MNSERNSRTLLRRSSVHITRLHVALVQNCRNCPTREGFSVSVRLPSKQPLGQRLHTKTKNTSATHVFRSGGKTPFNSENCSGGDALRRRRVARRLTGEQSSRQASRGARTRNLRHLHVETLLHRALHTWLSLSPSKGQKEVHEMGGAPELIPLGCKRKALQTPSNKKKENQKTVDTLGVPKKQTRRTKT